MNKDNLITLLQSIPGNPVILVQDEKSLQHSVNGFRQIDVTLTVLLIFKGEEALTV